ncbi:MAG: hypothetical protein GX868_02040 [Actinobacteria bacterium]|nr:hypothetical protein [Actinomycetota bacterium]
MMKLVDAVSHRFPQQNEWATRALASLTDVLEDDTPIHELVEGWCRVGDAQTGQLIDVLFVLTETRLGIGHAGDLHIERWVDLASIVVVDAIDNSLYPLQTIELQFSFGEPLTLGWPHPFSDQFVALLTRLRNAAEAAAAEQAAAEAAAAEPVAQPEPTAVEGAPALSALLGPRNAETVVVDDRDEVLAALERQGSPVSDERTAALDAAHETFFGDLEHSAPSPVAVPRFGADSRAPWDAMGAAWPADVAGVNYLGGHPSVKRRRKGGVMSFGRDGLRIRSAGVGRWDIQLDWEHTRSIDVQGPDEIMFSEALRVAPSSCVMIVEMTEGSRLFFEVTGRRPPSLRSEIAAVISMVDAGRTYRGATAETDN